MRGKSGERRQAELPRVVIVVAVVGTAVFLWSASSAVALSMGAGSLVTIFQNWLLARDSRKLQATA